MTTHLAAFSLADSVWRFPLWSPGPPWPFVEFAAVRSDILRGLDWIRGSAPMWKEAFDGSLAIVA